MDNKNARKAYTARRTRAHARTMQPSGESTFEMQFDSIQIHYINA